MNSILLQKSTLWLIMQRGRTDSTELNLNKTSLVQSEQIIRAIKLNDNIFGAFSENYTPTSIICKLDSNDGIDWKEIHHGLGKTILTECNTVKSLYEEHHRYQKIVSFIEFDGVPWFPMSVTITLPISVSRPFTTNISAFLAFFV